MVELKWKVRPSLEYSSNISQLTVNYLEIYGTQLVSYELLGSGFVKESVKNVIVSKDESFFKAEIRQ